MEVHTFKWPQLNNSKCLWGDLWLVTYVVLCVWCLHTDQHIVRANLDISEVSREGSLTIKQLQRHGAVQVLPPVLPVHGHWDLPVRPLACQVYAHARDHCGLVLEAEGGEVQAEEGEDDRGGCGGGGQRKGDGGESHGKTRG